MRADYARAEASETTRTEVARSEAATIVCPPGRDCYGSCINKIGSCINKVRDLKLAAAVVRTRGSLFHAEGRGHGNCGGFQSNESVDVVFA